MFRMALAQIKNSLFLLIIFTILTGLIYPAIVTGMAQLLFPWQANGSLIEKNHQILGSALIGQAFTADKYFWGRPSSTMPYPYNASSSAGSNLGPSNPDLVSMVKDRIYTYHAADNKNKNLIPIELVTASASGLDPDISPRGAIYQVPRIARIRNLPEKTLEDLIERQTQKRFLGFIGEPRVNVLLLNLALDELQKPTTRNVNARTAS